MQEPAKKTRNCPICKKALSDRLFYPFCSERCQMIDLGCWLDEKYSIPGDKEKDSLQEEE